MGRGEGAATLSTFTRIDENTGERRSAREKVGRWSEVAKYRWYRAEREGGGLLNILYPGTGSRRRRDRVTSASPPPPIPPSKNRVRTKVLDTFVYRYTGGYIFVVTR